MACPLFHNAHKQLDKTVTFFCDEKNDSIAFNASVSAPPNRFRENIFRHTDFSPHIIETMQSFDVERLFSGLIGAEYDLLKSICPAVVEVSQRVGQTLATWELGKPLKVFEIGCGTGITTLALLNARQDIILTAIDNEPTMLEQAKQNLAHWIDKGQLRLIETDAVSALNALPDNSVDVVASGYVTHNFLQGYRIKVFEEIYRVLKPGGAFINGDRYGLDDTLEHTRLTQEEVKFWFKTFGEMNRYDLLEHWIVHLFSDESPDHIMRLGVSLECIKEIGFNPISVLFREGINTLLLAEKPE